MVKGLEALQAMEYPGRFIILGQTPGNKKVAIYGITGRSSSSQARRLVAHRNVVRVEPTDPETLNQGNPELLIYDAINFTARGLAISNGKQTSSIADALRAPNWNLPIQILATALHNWTYEPDSPNFTPRISGCMIGKKNSMSSIRNDEERPLRTHFELPELMPGIGRLLSTYTGGNTNPLPSFAGTPLTLTLQREDASSLAKDVYDALAPPPGQPDFRVALSAITYQFSPKERDISIINRNEL